MTRGGADRLRLFDRLAVWQLFGDREVSIRVCFERAELQFDPTLCNEVHGSGGLGKEFETLNGHRVFGPGAGRRDDDICSAGVNLDWGHRALGAGQMEGQVDVLLDLLILQDIRMSQGAEDPRQLSEPHLIPRGFEVDIRYRETEGIHYDHHNDDAHNKQPPHDGVLSESLHPTRSAAWP